jgi:exodeoxyribonuclease V alpha subunit
MVRGGLGTHSLNVELQKALNPEGAPRVTRFGTTFAVGDRVIQTTNNYDKEVMNGAIGIVRAIREDDGTAVIDFDGNPVEYDFNGLDEVQLAYAVTIHKSQGSEFPAVVIPLAMQHYLLLQRRLLYTGVTRGRKLVVVVGQPKALGMAVRNANVERRVTNLAARLAAPKSTDEAGA